MVASPSARRMSRHAAPYQPACDADSTLL
jgi:hypothetical protein